MKTLTYGVLPPRGDLLTAFYALCKRYDALGQEIPARYEITHGSNGPDWRPSEGTYTFSELWAELERLQLLQRVYDACDGDATQDDSPGQWISDILSTLGFEWV